MSFSPEIAERRFGYGLSPEVAPPASVPAMLDGLRGPDRMAERFPIDGFDAVQEAMRRYRGFRKTAVASETAPEAARAAREKADTVIRDLKKRRMGWFLQVQLRRVHGGANFRERLVAFWADHFTAQGKNPVTREVAATYVEEAVRPHVGGRFTDLLMACVSHPLMLDYLDQTTSVGPGSRRGQDRDRPAGLNENLARELLELHTLGVGGPYTQADVREMAKLLTGMTRTADYAFVFRGGWAEPGGETVLGKTYGGRADMAPIRAALEDLALHPVTARHLAGKLAAHFIADDPPRDIVDRLARVYRDSGGDLMTTYAALLEHDAAWVLPASNIRPPEEYIATALRALAVPEATMTGLGFKEVRRLFWGPLVVMGQDWERPGGPDGWPEADGAWVTPQGVAARLDWAMNVPARLLRDLPEPRDFVDRVVGAAAPEKLRFAAGAAENRAEAIGLVLASPSMQRR